MTIESIIKSINSQHHFIISYSLVLILVLLLELSSNELRLNKFENLNIKC